MLRRSGQLEAPLSTVAMDEYRRLKGALITLTSGWLTWGAELLEEIILGH